MLAHILHRQSAILCFTMQTVYTGCLASCVSPPLRARSSVKPSFWANACMSHTDTFGQRHAWTPCSLHALIVCWPFHCCTCSALGDSRGTSSGLHPKVRKAGVLSLLRLNGALRVQVKQKGGSVEQIVIADMAFDVLKTAWAKFEAAELRR